MTTMAAPPAKANAPRRRFDPIGAGVPSAPAGDVAGPDDGNDRDAGSGDGDAVDSGGATSRRSARRGKRQADRERSD